jgi:type IV pilus assembly protein PilA
MKNKGFSLVELIIVIAIMAILAAAIAPALIRYIDKSRKADDLTAGGTINSAVSAALANEDAYDELQGTTNQGIGIVSKDYISIVGGGALSKEISNNLDQKVSPKYKKEQQSSFIIWADAKGNITVAANTGSSFTVPDSKWWMQPSIGETYK